MRHCKRSFHRARRPTIVSRLTYHGYKIVIVNNHWYSFRYEYLIYPPKSAPRKIRRLKVVTDPTSHRSKEAALDNARCHVNEMRSPFWIWVLDHEV